MFKKNIFFDFQKKCRIDHSFMIKMIIIWVGKSKKRIWEKMHNRIDYFYASSSLSTCVIQYFYFFSSFAVYASLHMSVRFQKFCVLGYLFVIFGLLKVESSRFISLFSAFFWCSHASRIRDATKETIFWFHCDIVNKIRLLLFPNSR